jgi:hypothetical protein
VALSAIFAGLIHLVFATYFTVSGTRLFCKRKDQKFGRKQTKMTRFVLVNSVFMYCLTIALFIPASPAFFSPQGWYTVWTIVYFFAHCISTTQILVFSVPKYFSSGRMVKDLKDFRLNVFEKGSSSSTLKTSDMSDLKFSSSGEDEEGSTQAQDQAISDQFEQTAAKI